MTERPKFIRKTVFQGSGGPSIRFEECQNEQQEIEPKSKKTTNPADFPQGWQKHLRDSVWESSLEDLNPSDIDNSTKDGAILEK